MQINPLSWDSFVVFYFHYACAYPVHFIFANDSDDFGEPPSVTNPRFLNIQTCDLLVYYCPRTLRRPCPSFRPVPRLVLVSSSQLPFLLHAFYAILSAYFETIPNVKIKIHINCIFSTYMGNYFSSIMTRTLKT